MSYVGGPGFELYVPVEMARHVYLALHRGERGPADGCGLRDAGYYALDALRIEAGRRAWGAELGPDETPFEAGLMFAVKLDKHADFIGRAALLPRRTSRCARSSLTVVLDDAASLGLGRRGASLHRRRAGRRVTSAGWSDAPGPASASATCAARPRARPCRHAAGGRPVGCCSAATAWERWTPAMT